LNKEKIWFTAWSNSLTTIPTFNSEEKKNDYINNLITDDNLKNVENFLSYYQSQMERLDSSFTDLNQKLEKNQEEQKKIKFRKYVYCGNTNCH